LGDGGGDDDGGGVLLLVDVLLRLSVDKVVPVDVSVGEDV
jgi:hypothetical protein